MNRLEITIAGEIALSKEPGKSMRKWREIFGVTQTELAEHLNISPSTISDYEGGRRSSPGIAIIRRLVRALIEVDQSRGSQIAKKIADELSLGEEETPFKIHDFFKAIDGKEFVRKIQGKAITGKARLEDTKIYGYTIIDSLKAIVEVPVHDYLKLFGQTPDRALVFCKVSSGRSPMIAVKIGKFSTDMKPSLIVMHGIDNVDPLAAKIAESERIPLVVTKMPLKELEIALKSFET
ncbi:MAG: helix-turn-helix domain-containing protein [Candidatus Diapherotrites archaeon]|nr:helix-turn-helix domain-containing protein [Candidatus Diapherotrites archaeon]